MVDTPAIWKPEHQVNLTDAFNQNNPAVISIGNGRYLVAWVEQAGGPISTTNGTDIVGQIFDALGNPVGAEFQLNQSFFGDNELDVALAGKLGGGFVMVYVDDGGNDGIRIEHYDLDGVKIAGPTAILASGGADNLDAPQVAMGANGSHLVVYERDHGGGDVDIVGKFVNPDGSLGAEFLIHADSENNLEPTVAALSNGNFVVSYENEWGVGANTHVDFRIITPGVPPTVGPNTFVDLNVSTTDQDDPKVAALEGGGFVIVYNDNAAGSDEIRAAIYDNNGAVVKAAFTVNGNLPGTQDDATVAALPDGGFVVVWDDANFGLLRGQRFDSAGNEVGTEFTAGTIGSEDDPVITVLDDGRFFVGYEQLTGDNDAWGTIFDPREKTITGTGEDDLLTAFAEGGTVKGKGGDDMLLGSGFGDTLIGGGGSDYLVGMDGNDDLKGGKGQDFFVFAAALDKNNNVDTIKDFRKKQKDKILLLDDIFPAVGEKLDKGELYFGNNAKNGGDHIIVKVQASKNKATLFYDEDGAGGTGKVKFAVLEYKGNLDLNHKSFKVIEDLDL